MHNYQISNKKELEEFLDFARRCGHDCHSIKGSPPKDAVYSDGDPVTRPVNVAWVNDFTGETFEINYARLQ